MLVHNNIGKKKNLSAHRNNDAPMTTASNDSKEATVTVIIIINFHFFNYHYLPSTVLGTSQMISKP